jgi:catechol 2,3-dioxygenase-like lactoylglutathione lyase family enzyme
MNGRAHHVVIDCPDPRALATFYCELLGLVVSYESKDWVVIAASSQASGFAFQLVVNYVPPVWPDPDRPQQVHLDVMVDDVPLARSAVLSLGATPLRAGVHVYADPAGHPFCLIPRPSWAPPIRASTRPSSSSQRQSTKLPFVLTEGSDDVETGE